MALTSSDLALLHTLVLNVVVLAGAWLLARRFTRDRLQAILDALLLWLGVQYVVVGVLGAVGGLHASAITVAGLLAGGMLAAAGKPWRARPAASAPLRLTGDQRWAVVVSLFVLGYIAVYGFVQRSIPPTATDALAYHLPTAIQWLQDGAIHLWPAWYWNLANSYSPLAGETFIAWLLAPAGNDVFARFVQVGPLLITFLCVVQLGRAAGTGNAAAALAGAALVLSRPMFSQAFLVKDDLIMTALLAASAVALHPPRLREGWGPLRLGLALGLLLAVKYPALVVLPVLLLMADAPLRAGWRARHYATFAATAFLLAGPWFIRNAVLTGNPLYPLEIVVAGKTLLRGLFTVARNEQLRSVHGVWQMLTCGYHAIPPWLLASLAAGGALAAGMAPRRLLREPVFRLCMLGPALGLAAFVALSPHPEVRYFFPSLVPLFASAAIAAYVLLRGSVWRFAPLLALLAGSVATGFATELSEYIGDLVLWAMGVCICGLLAFRLAGRSRGICVGMAAAAVAAFALFAYVYWSAYVNVYREATDFVWHNQYSPEADLWTYVREQTPPNAVVAYAGTNFIYPLYGFELSRRVEYVPTSADFAAFANFPPLGRDIEGYDLVPLTTKAMQRHPDFGLWLKRLRERQITHLAVFRTLGDSPPELSFAAEHPDLLRKLYETPAGAVFELVR